MTEFDQRLAARAREAFDAYDEPADEAALARIRAALGHTAPDRPPVRLRASRRRLGAVLLAAVFLAGVGLWVARPTAPPIAEASETTAPERAGPPRRTETRPPPATEVPGLARSQGAERARPPAPSLIARAAIPSAAPPPAAPTRLTPTADSTPRPDPAAAMQPEPSRATDEPGAAAIAAPMFAMPVLADPVFVASVPRPESVVPRGASAARSGVRLVAGASALSGSAVTEGIGVAAGVTRSLALGRGLALSGGVLVALDRFSVESGAVPTALAEIEADPTRTVRVTRRSRVETVAFEIPLDVGAHLATVPGGRLGGAVGLTSAVVLAQSFDDEGDVLGARRVPDPAGGEPLFVATSEPFEARETSGLRLDAARQVSLMLRYTTSGALGVDLIARLPLRGATDRGVSLSSVGARLRVALP